MRVRYLLDTNVLSEPMRARPDGGLMRRLRRHDREVAIGTPVWHELVYGCARLPLSHRREAIETYLREVVEPSIPILPYSREAADWHGKERAEYFYTLCSRYGGEYGRDMFDLRETLSSVTCPALVMYPDRGHFFEVEQGVAFYRHLPKGELAVFPKCGHNIHEHYPAEYIRQVLHFLAKNKGETD